jgi:lycopene beta-cyclase
VLDAIFLRVLRSRPTDGPALYLRMFRRVPPRALVRFLSERAGAADVARLILAMPKRPFLAAALRSLPALLDAAR